MLKECQVSELINQSGRLRMLSHRASMMLAQIAAGVSDPWFIEELEISINKFETSYKNITQTVHAEKNLKLQFETLLNSQVQRGAAIAHAVNNYLTQIQRYHAAIKHGRKVDSELLNDFLKFVATDLLVALNSIVSFFESVLNQIANDKLKNIQFLAKNIESAIDEVDQINLSIKILSFNASVEAARAGDVGKGFAVVSKEMNNLSSNTRRVTQTVKDTVLSFVDELNN